MSDHEVSGKISKSVQEVSKRTSFSKSDARYWKTRIFRNSYTRGGERVETNDWCLKLAHGGERETVNLKTPNADAAATRARDFYRAVIAEGWTAALGPYRSKSCQQATEDVPTLGAIITAAEARAVHLRPTTLRHYIGCLRQIASGIGGVKAAEDRRNYAGGGTKKWRDAVDALPVSEISPESLRSWQTKYLKSAGSDPARIRSARTSANSITGSAARLFTPQMLAHYADAGVAVAASPFGDLKPFPKQDARYISRLDASTVLERARDELLTGKPLPSPALFGITKSVAALALLDWPQVYRVILLGTMTGLRRSELDRLQWSHVNFKGNSLVVQSTEDGNVKGVGSTREIDLPPDLIALMAEWKNATRSTYVIECAKVPTVKAAAKSGTHRRYRCARVFDKAAAWLREHFLPGEHHPLHTLRKRVWLSNYEKRGYSRGRRTVGTP